MVTTTELWIAAISCGLGSPVVLLLLDRFLGFLQGRNQARFSSKLSPLGAERLRLSVELTRKLSDLNGQLRTLVSPARMPDVDGLLATEFAEADAIYWSLIGELDVCKLVLPESKTSIIDEIKRAALGATSEVESTIDVARGAPAKYQEARQEARQYLIQVFEPARERLNEELRRLIDAMK